MRKQLQSFKNAFEGVWNTVKTESHMRFHMVAAFYVILFSFFYSFTVTQWVILVFLIASVFALEIINTCIEQLCNLYVDFYDRRVKLIKDAASGAVLVAAAAATVTAVIFFFKLSVIMNIFRFFLENPLLLILFLISAIISVIFVWLGPSGIKKLFNR